MINTEQLKGCFEMILLTNRIKAVERSIVVPELQRWETTSEHSHQVAMLAWYLSTVAGLELNQEKVIKFALIHDLVEAYAGDVCLFNDAAKEQKLIREKQATETIRGQFPEFPLADWIDEYESQESPEARFAEFCDKLAPTINDLMDGMQGCIKKNVPASKLKSAWSHMNFPEGQSILNYLLSLVTAAFKAAGREDLADI